MRRSSATTELVEARLPVGVDQPGGLELCQLLELARKFARTGHPGVLDEHRQDGRSHPESHRHFEANKISWVVETAPTGVVAHLSPTRPDDHEDDTGADDVANRLPEVSSGIKRDVKPDITDHRRTARSVPLGGVQGARLPAGILAAVTDTNTDGRAGGWLRKGSERPGTSDARARICSTNPDPPGSRAVTVMICSIPGARSVVQRTTWRRPGSKSAGSASSSPFARHAVIPTKGPPPTFVIVSCHDVSAVGTPGLSFPQVPVQSPNCPLEAGWPSRYLRRQIAARRSGPSAAQPASPGCAPAPGAPPRPYVALGAAADRVHGASRLRDGRLSLNRGDLLRRQHPRSARRGAHR